LLGAAGGAYAFDDKVFDDKTSTEKNSNPWTVFRFGFSAYKSGHKDQAVEAYRYAAENGQLGATWKLARMYAEGDGVTRDDYDQWIDDRWIDDRGNAAGSYYALQQCQQGLDILRPAWTRPTRLVLHLARTVLAYAQLR
jgi:TPR repeat protein